MKRRQFLANLTLSAGALLAGSRCGSKERQGEPASGSGSGSGRTGDVIIEPERRIPVLARTDVLVVGGGPAGVAAAVAAGRAGADVVLVERYNHLGGLWTGGLVLPLLSTHAVDSEGEFQRVLYGIGGEIEGRLRDMGMIINEVNGVIDPEAGKYVLEIMIRDAGIRVLYHAWAGNVLITDNRIEAVMVETKSGRGAIVPKIVVDCSGDGDMLHLAGEDYEIMNYQVGLVHRLGNTDRIDSSRPGYKKLNIGKSTPVPGVNWVNMTTGVDEDGLDAWHLAELQQQYRIDIWQTFDKIRSTPGYEKLFVLDTASQLGVRMSRILNGAHKLSQQETMTHRSFTDVVGVSGAWTDILYRGRRVPWRTGRPMWQIPYRALLPQKTENLLVAGRCFSFERALFEDARIIATCLITGHAAGAAAALAARHNTPVQRIDIERLQSLLRSQKANLG